MRLTQIRIVVGEDSVLVREGLQQLLAVDPDVEVVAAVADEPSLRRACDEASPDVVLTDIRMPPTDTDEGIRFAAELRDRHPDIGVVDPEPVRRPALCAGAARAGAPTAARYLLKERVHNRAELMAGDPRGRRRAAR